MVIELLQAEINYFGELSIPMLTGVIGGLFELSAEAAFNVQVNPMVRDSVANFGETALEFGIGGGWLRLGGIEGSSSVALRGRTKYHLTTPLIPPCS